MGRPPRGVPGMTIHAPWTRPAAAGELVLGFVNNMPPPAMATAEWQFRTLIEQAAGPRTVHLRLFALPAPRDDGAAPAFHYEPLDALWDSRIDGLIVTGTEPRAASIRHEPYWPFLARVVDWAAGNTLSTLWSCLGAHAAVLHLDGVERRRLPDKLSGVFDCATLPGHPLLADAPARFAVPHSRTNGLDEDELTRRGYTLLSRGDRVGADTFLKPVGRSLFLMLQGHPEYDPECLLREYRRDVRRFVEGRVADYPRPPEGYFGADTMGALAALREATLAAPGFDPLPGLHAAARAPASCHWRQASVRLFASWLGYLAGERATGSSAAPVPHETQLAAG